MKQVSQLSVLVLAAALFGSGLLAGCAMADEDKITQEGPVTVYKPGSRANEGVIDEENARPMPLPQATIKPGGTSAKPPPDKGASGVVAGSPGNGAPDETQTKAPGSPDRK